MAKGFEYRIDGGTPVDAGDVLTIPITGLSASTSYNFEVRKRSDDGSYSAWSSVASGTTASGGWAGPTTNLTHRWPMEDANVSGSTITDVIGSINGTATATLSSSAGPGSHTARTLNGTSHEIDLASSPLPAVSSPHSVFMWVYGDSTAADKATVFGDFQSAGNGVRFIYDIPAAVTGLVGGILVHIDKGGTEFAWASGNSGESASLNTWHHIGYTWDGTSTIIIYLDGSPITGTGAVGGSGAIASGHTIGARGDGTDYLKGRIYNAVTYSAAISSGTVASLYAAQ